MAELLRSSEVLHKEQGQTVVWLVGLASTMLVLLSTKNTLVAAGMGKVRVAPVALFCTVAFGVLQRIASLRLQEHERSWMHLLHLSLDGLAYTTAQDPPPPSDYIPSVALQLLSNHFGIDYSSLTQLNPKPELFNEIYRAQYEAWQEVNNQRSRDFEILLAASRGEQVPVVTTPSNETGQVDSAGVSVSSVEGAAKQLSKDFHKLERASSASTVFYIAMCISFAAALLVTLVAVMSK